MVRKNSYSLIGLFTVLINRANKPKNINHIAFILSGDTELLERFRVNRRRERFSELAYRGSNVTGAGRIRMSFGQSGVPPVANCITLPMRTEPGLGVRARAHSVPIRHKNPPMWANVRQK